MVYLAPLGFFAGSALCLLASIGRKLTGACSAHARLQRSRVDIRRKLESTPQQVLPLAVAKHSCSNAVVCYFEECSSCHAPKTAGASLVRQSWRRSAPSLAALRENESALWGAGGRDAARWEGDQSSAEVNGFNARMAEVFDEQHFISPTFR